MTPTQKMRVVSILKEMGNVVAVTGDGVNDAPALKKADIGIAMGIAGTDVAKEAADIVVLDDNFATIVNAVEEGRAVYENIRKFVTYILASNIPELVPYLASVVFRIPLLLTVVQILGVDLGTDMLPALGLGAEPPDARTMDRPPRSKEERLLNLPLLARSYLFLGPIEAAAAVGAGLWYLADGGWQWGMRLPSGSPLYRQATTVCFAAIVLCQVANVFACRTKWASSFSCRPLHQSPPPLGRGGGALYSRAYRLPPGRAPDLRDRPLRRQVLVASSCLRGPASARRRSKKGFGSPP